MTRFILLGLVIAAIPYACDYLVDRQFEEHGYTRAERQQFDALVTRVTKPKLVKPASEAERNRLIADVFRGR